MINKNNVKRSFLVNNFANKECIKKNSSLPQSLSFRIASNGTFEGNLKTWIHLNGQDQHQFSPVILTRERNSRSRQHRRSAQTRMETVKPGEGELVAARIKSSHLIKLLWAGSLFPRRNSVSRVTRFLCVPLCLEIRDEDLEKSWLCLLAPEDRERRRSLSVNCHSSVCQQLEKLIWILIGIDINLRRIVIGGWD